ncbi:class I SAM-dependent methyltransferase [Methylobacillus caricis]|uniref:class I SAM-dependent methyltransferase n=1 Tax=Methylobacillus caricis TaxID=1971611 RepID=UPI001CFF88F9|nr:class I SAM-dependent methyltransferase [Methylobacillus caricis]MCB5187525.1 class I SAM-dependent methyltransferase [Methylobacillus caricis]
MKIHSPQPSSWVMRHSAHIRPEGSVLDLASGTGRNARWLASQGFQVEAADKDESALYGMREVANIAIRHVDLENGEWSYADSRFDAIVVCRYLYRPLLPLLNHSLASGGVLIYETFMQGHEAFGRPSNPDFLLAPNELLHVFQPVFRVMAYEEGMLQSAPDPAVLQRIVAIKA